MPRNARCVAPGLPVPLTQRGSNRQKVFFSAADRHLYFRLVRENLAETGVRVLAYCLMTNHVHLVVVPDREDSLAVLMRRVHGRYSQFINVRRGRSGHLWQARYYSCPLSEVHLWMAVKYVEENPCRAGLVSRPELYRYSSAATHRLGVKDASGILDLDFWRRAGGVETWTEIHREPLAERDLVALRKCTYGGRPFGDEEFIEQMEERFGRQWRRSQADFVGQIAKSA